MPVFRIRIHWIRIGSQEFFWIRIQPVANTGTIPDPDSDQDLFRQNVSKNYFDQKPSDFSLWTPTKRRSDSSQMKFLNFLILGANFGLSGSGYGPVCGDPIESGSKTTQDPRCYPPTTPLRLQSADHQIRPFYTYHFETFRYNSPSHCVLLVSLCGESAHLFHQVDEGQVV